jgi:ElaB/YqjD/DUF883 family membrane-anchored ribosome-binding protein
MAGERIPTTQQAAGRAKMVAGARMGDARLYAEGRMEEAAGSPQGDARSMAKDAKAEITHLRQEIEELSHQPATPGLDAAAATAEEYGQRLDEALDVVREHPLVAVASAAVLGYLVGRLTARTTYVYPDGRRAAERRRGDLPAYYYPEGQPARGSIWPWRSRPPRLRPVGVVMAEDRRWW